MPGADKYIFDGRAGNPGLGAQWPYFTTHPQNAPTGFDRIYALGSGRVYKNRAGTLTSFALEQQANIFTLLNRFKDVQLDDQDGTPVADRVLRNIDGLIRAASTGLVEGRHISEASLQLITDGTLATPYIKADGTRAFTGHQSLGGFRLTNVLDPSSAQDAATKAYVDAIASGLDLKASVRVATTANVNLANALESGDSIDGVTLATGDRVLVKSQTDPAENGIYVVPASGAASRATDADVSAEVTAGMFTFVSEGTVNGNTGWVLITDDPITLGTTGLSFTQFSAATSIDHGSLTGLGDDDHTQYALADKSRPATWVAAGDLAGRSIADLGTKTHSLLTGLATDDHTQYILVAGSRAFSADQSMGSHKLTDVTDPAAAQDAATKAYVDSKSPWTTVKKTTTQTKNSDTTLAADTVLKFTMAANTKYAFKLVVHTDSAAAADFKWRHVGPATPDLVQIERRAIAPGATAYSNIRIDSAYSAADVTMLDSGGSTPGYIEMNGTIHNGANAGDFEFHWAQNTSDAGNTKVLAGSYLEWMTIA